MAYKFPSAEWLQALKDKLNTDERYAKIASNWEGDLLFHIEPDKQFPEANYFYLDLWHGKCREAFILDKTRLDDFKPVFILKAPFGNFIRLLKGELEPMQAMITRKLKVQGSMAYMMRNVPVVLDFVRCAQEIDTEI